MIIRILMVDDHPSQLEGYKAILSYNEAGHAIEAVTAYSCESAYNMISNPANADRFDLVFLDLSLPPYIEKQIHSGEDLAVLVRNTWPKTKIMMLTSHSEAILLYNIIKKSAPEGLLVKSDFTGNDFLTAFEKIIAGEKQYSQTVSNGLKELLSREKFLDSINREILILMAKGVKLKSMPDILNLSHSAIEKRKNFIRDFLCIEKGTDEDILREAKKLGFI